MNRSDKLFLFWMPLVSLAIAALGIALIIGCQSIERSARDAIAAFQGYLIVAQEKHTMECLKSQGLLTVCETLTKADYAENAAVTALEAYCGFAPHSDPKQTCHPVKSNQAALQAALSNLQQLEADIKGAAQ